ncbi:Amidohydrolase [Rhizobium freirei PRF 81]|uniref:Amidohydrolase n=1 Tax=Rhizobium freirei PRF 81 TaxID=363754 RepID=N6V4Q2_9HYPH|nr:hypothetical protein [Rhizobium freirei]ENN86007.1 Amidohydrolase [Rhizobium freirei PRF 81]
MSDFDLVLTGRVVGTDRVRDNGYVAVRGGLVERMGEGSPPSAVLREDFGSALIFVPCRHGRSHTPDDGAEPEAIAAGAATLLEMIMRLDETLDIPSSTEISI